MSKWFAVFAITAPLGFVAIMSAQSRTPSLATGAGGDELLTEIKLLRADLNQRLDASVRTQLLVARLQLQEQRITTLSTQLTDIQQQLQNNERARGPLEAQVKAFEASRADAPEHEKKQADFVTDSLRSTLEQLVRADDTLKQQQAQVSSYLAEEQSRWSAFNARLEELERLLMAPKTPPRDR